MKITKQRLKEIIREELANEGKRTDMSMPALSDDDFYQSKRDRSTHRAIPQSDFEPDPPAWEGEPFGEYDLEAENEKGRLAAAEELGLDPADPSLWEKILDAVRRANVFEDPRRGMEESSQSGSTQGRGSPGARSESGFAKGTRSRRAGGPKKRAKKTTSKTDRASSKRDLKK